MARGFTLLAQDRGRVKAIEEAVIGIRSESWHRACLVLSVPPNLVGRADLKPGTAVISPR